MNKNTLSFLKSPKDVAKSIAEDFKELRLSKNISQKVLAEKSGVSLSSLKRFETTGEISLKSLILLVFVLDKKQELLDIFKLPEFQSIEEVKKSMNIKIRKRGNDKLE